MISLHSFHDTHTEGGSHLHPPPPTSSAPTPPALHGRQPPSSATHPTHPHYCAPPVPPVRRYAGVVRKLHHAKGDLVQVKEGGLGGLSY